MRYLALLLIISCSSSGYKTAGEAICAACQKDIEKRHGQHTVSGFDCRVPNNGQLKREAVIYYDFSGSPIYARYNAYELANADTLLPTDYRLELMAEGEQSKPGEVREAFDEMMRQNRARSGQD